MIAGIFFYTNILENTLFGDLGSYKCPLYCLLEDATVRNAYTFINIEVIIAVAKGCVIFDVHGNNYVHWNHYYQNSYFLFSI